MIRYRRDVNDDWMIFLQLLLHPLGSEQYNYRDFFIRIRELWICYCLLDDLPPIIIASPR